MSPLNNQYTDHRAKYPPTAPHKAVAKSTRPMPQLATSNPAHTKGCVKASGNKVVLASMAASVNKVAANPAQANAAGVRPWVA